MNIPSSQPDPIAASKSWPIYKRLLGYSRSYLGLFGIAVLGMILDAACTAGFTHLLRPLMDEGFLADNWNAVRTLPWLVAAIFVGRALGTLVSDYAMSAVGRSVIFDLRQELFEKLIDLPAKFFDRFASGQLISRLTFNVEQVANASTNAITILVRDSLYIAGFFVVMLYNSVTLTLIVVGVGPVIALLAAVVSKRFRRLSRRIQSSVGDVAHRSSEVIQGHLVVKSFGAQPEEKKLFAKINRQNRRQNLKLVLTKAASASIVQVIAGFALAGIIYVATSHLSEQGMTAGSFIAFITAMLAILPSLRRLTNVLEMVQRGVAAADSIFEILDRQGETDHGDETISKLRGAVDYRNVSMSYDESGQAALDDVSFSVAPGTTTAIVGRSGSGKTTLVNLLPRFYVATEGTIAIDGTDIRNIKLPNLRQNIAIVGQQIVLFNDTIAANIAYGRLKSIDRERIEAAAQQAGAMEFIDALPHGLDTHLGADGIQLSGGQRQRIAIARAILQDAPILILDEATSALDSESEQQIYAALENLREGRTTLVIAHKLSTIESADQVLVMDQGRLIERGTHKSLIQDEGVYANLHRLQFGIRSDG